MRCTRAVWEGVCFLAGRFEAEPLFPALRGFPQKGEASRRGKTKGELRLQIFEEGLDRLLVAETQLAVGG